MWASKPKIYTAINNNQRLETQFLNLQTALLSSNPACVYLQINYLCQNGLAKDHYQAINFEILDLVLNLVSISQLTSSYLEN